MKIEIKDGNVIATSETLEEASAIIAAAMILPEKAKEDLNLEPLKNGVGKHGSPKYRICECGKKVKRTGYKLHVTRSHEGKYWSSRKKTQTTETA